MEDVAEAIHTRPKMMTVVAVMAGLSPFLWGTDSEVKSRIAAPMVGGMISFRAPVQRRYSPTRFIFGGRRFCFLSASRRGG